MTVFIEFISIFVEWWWKKHNELSNQKKLNINCCKRWTTKGTNIPNISESHHILSVLKAEPWPPLEIELVCRGMGTKGEPHHKLWVIYLLLHTDFHKLASVTSMRNAFVFSLYSLMTQVFCLFLWVFFPGRI